MKKQEKIDIIKHGISQKEICRCYFTYDENYFYYYPNAVNEKFILGQEEGDFLLNGYNIRKTSQLKKVEIKDDKCNEINILIGLTKQIKSPNVDISSWNSIFTSLKQLDKFIIIEDAINEQFAIGLIEKVYKNKINFRTFDTDGLWDSDFTEIPFSSITNVAWETRYTKNWEEYLRNRKN